MPYLHAIYSQTRELLAGYKFCRHVEIRALLDHIVQILSVPRFSGGAECAPVFVRAVFCITTSAGRVLPSLLLSQINLVKSKCSPGCQETALSSHSLLL